MDYKIKISAKISDICGVLFPADCADVRRKRISENQRYLREIVSRGLRKLTQKKNQRKLAASAGDSFPRIAQIDAEKESAKIGGICGR